MIKDAIQYLLTLGQAHYKEVNGRTYADKNLILVQPPAMPELRVSTLTGVVDYIKERKAELGGDFFLHVPHYQLVRVVSGLDLATNRRECFLKASLPVYEPYPFSQFMLMEDFLIQLQAKFAPSDTVTSILKLFSSIKEENVETSQDDGISQVVTAKTGVAMVKEVNVPNPVTLRPYRTFMEVAQPQETFVLRLRSHGELEVALFEADGWQWKLAALRNIRAFFEKELPDVPVIA
jgi:hypothetical protein